MGEVKTNGLGIASMVIGIFSMVTICCFGGFLGIIGLILGIVALNIPNSKKGQAIAGVVTSGIAFLATLLLLLTGSLGSIFDNTATNIDTSTQLTTEATTEKVTEATTEKKTEATTEEKTEATTESKTEVTTTEEELTLGQLNALDKALQYLNYTSFSYSGLIDQLEYEGFTTEESTYAVDSCGANWNEQAAYKAADYMNYSSFSKSSLIEQLEFEGFTAEQAEYGATAVGF